MTDERASGRLCCAGLVLMCGILWLSMAVARPASSDPATPGHVEEGLASFYGPGFNGRETASGEVFDERRMVAAHRTLPLGSVVQVTNLRNGRQVKLRVIDRGPYGANYRKGTIIDVSRGAARRLGFLRAGLVPVRIEVLEVPDEGERSAGATLPVTPRPSVWGARWPAGSSCAAGCSTA